MVAQIVVDITQILKRLGFARVTAPRTKTVPFEKILERLTQFAQLRIKNSERGQRVFGVCLVAQRFKVRQRDLLRSRAPLAGLNTSRTRNF